VEEYPYADSGQLAEVIAQVGSSSVQEVLFISSDTQTIIGFLDSVASLAQYETKTLFMTDPAANPDVLAEASGTALARVRGTRPAPLDEDEDVYASFIAAYAGQFGDDVRGFPFTPNVYDAAWLLAYGAAWATLREEAGIAGSTMARGLRRVSDGQDVEIRPSSWSSVLQVFRNAGSVDVKGASGELDFDPDTEETSAGIEVWQVQNRSITPIYTIQP
jgi:branched-chain amino acid transport system substrate-binding protein